MKFWQELTTPNSKYSITIQGFIALVCVLLSLSLGQLGRVEYGAVVYPHDVLIGVYFLLQLPLTLGTARLIPRQVFTKRQPALASLLGWTVLGMLVATAAIFSVTPWLYFVRILYYLVFAYMVGKQLSTKPKLLRSMLAVSGLYMVWLGLLQFLFIPDTRFLFVKGWDEHYYRLIGPMLDPNFSGILFILFGWYIVSLKKQWPAFLWYLSLISCVTALALTYSRASFLALIISVIVYVLYSKQLHQNISRIFTGVFLIMGLIAISLYLAPKPGGEGVNLLRTESILARYESSTRFLQTLTPLEWILGRGLAFEAADTTHAKAPDNLLILLLSSTGIVGTALALWWLASVLPRLNKLDAAAVAVLTALLVHAQFNNTVLEPFVLLYAALGIVSFAKESS